MDRLLNIDRRIISIFVAVAVTIPLLRKFNMPVIVTRDVKSIYNKINSLPAGSHVLISFDYVSPCPSCLDVISSFFACGHKKAGRGTQTHPTAA